MRMAKYIQSLEREKSATYANQQDYHLEVKNFLEKQKLKEDSDTKLS